jgi:hypothetical protein
LEVLNRYVHRTINYRPRGRKSSKSERLEDPGAIEIPPIDSTSAAMREAMREAGFGSPGDPAYTRLVLGVMRAASERLSSEDRQLIN